MGTRMPPAAAIAGCVAFPAEFSSPLVSSNCSSTATTKKKIASSPSLIQCSTESSKTPGMPRYTCIALSTAGPAGLFATTRPSAAATRRMTAGKRSDRSRLMPLLSGSGNRNADQASRHTLTHRNA